VSKCRTLQGESPLIASVRLESIVCVDELRERPARQATVTIGNQSTGLNCSCLRRSEK